jgi:chromosome segregation ATPase
MGVVDNIKKAGGSVSKGAGKFTQIQIQQRKLRSLQGDVGRAEQEMGGLVFDLVERGDLVHPALDAPQAKVREASALVDAKEAEIAKLKAEPEGEDGVSARDAYVERLKTQLGGWSADIEMLKARAGKISADAKAEYEEQLAGLREQRDTLAAKVADLQAASDEAWEGLKQGVQAAWDRAKDNFQKAVSRFGRDGGA